MNGAESLIKTLVNNGVEVCFTNPGTSEMHFVAALDEVDGMRAVLVLFEGVASGAADGYARMARKPASTLLHLGPGLSNASANIHNAKKGNVPMINIVGDHATYHVQYNAPLTADIEGLAAPVSHWVHTSESAEQIAGDTNKAIMAAGHNQIATLILPADVSWSDNPNGDQSAVELAALNPVSEANIAAAAELLAGGSKTMILVGGAEVSYEIGLLLSQLARHCGVRICLETFPSRVRHGAGAAQLERLPYLAEMAIDHLKEVDNLILLGAASPVSFFAYPNVPSTLSAQQCHEMELAKPGDDLQTCLQSLIEHLGAGDAEPVLNAAAPPEPATGALNAASLAQSFAHYLPEDAIVVDEGATSTMVCFPFAAGAAQHDWLNLTGGSIGYGLPCAVGAAIACPDRKVICFDGDGSAMYTIQSLWTMAREQLDITVVICSNRKYNILELEFARTEARGGKPGPKAASMLNIGEPDMDFVAMAQGMGVEASRAATIDEFNVQFAAAMQSKGPRLIDALIEPLQF